MQSNKLILKNPRTGQIKTAPIGFSWTVVLFGFFIPLYRSDWPWVIIMLVFGSFTYGLGTLLFAPFYNQFYARSLVNKGYQIYSIEGQISRRRANRILGIKTSNPTTKSMIMDSQSLLKEVAEQNHK